LVDEEESCLTGLHGTRGITFLVMKWTWMRG
jgi:hypothetical protein